MILEKPGTQTDQARMNILAKNFYDCKSDVKISETLLLTYYNDEMKVLFRQSCDVDDENMVMYFMYDNNLFNEININDFDVSNKE